MSTYTQIIYHIVFSTKNWQPVLKANSREELFKYIWGIINNKKGHLYRINAVEDHVHILTSIHQTVCLADFVKEIKVGSSRWIKQNNIFPGFSGWQDGYGAFTHSIKEKESLIKYIMNQQEHHREINFKEEYRKMLIEAGIEFDEKYFP
jgi:REP element-mobilizing transposase RayT